jgi:tetratricopeptide (TPR) repeat protein
MLRRLSPGDNADTANALTGLAACRLRLGRVDIARGDYTAALEMRRRLYGTEHEHVAAALNNLAKCDLDVDSFDTAEAAFREAYAMVRKLKGDGYVNTAAAATNLADCLLRRAEVDLLESNSPQALSRAEEAIELYQRSLDVRTKKFPDGHDSTVVSLSGLARSSLILGRQKEALDYAARGLAMMRKVRRPDHPGIIDVLDTSAQVASSNNDLAGARNFYEQAIEIASKNKSIPAGRMGELRGGFGMVLVQLGETEAGLKLLHAAETAMITAHGNTSVAARLARQQITEAEKTIASQNTNKSD